ncbi:hypothetical protein [Streptomyces sp. L2]|uniref:hypothetical protein n=1 Tax=Streptomyces sp. L2 TaxID=2162665 RepID=UPI0010124BFE|nr:hypothetical protein [Streptomyces sp. L2]
MNLIKDAYGNTFGAPCGELPGARFSAALYQKIAQLPLDDFTELRLKVLNLESYSSTVLALKRSFYSPGFALLPFTMISLTAADACAQHAFRYTVGPNVYRDCPQTGAADRWEADAQLARVLGYRLLPSGPLPAWMTALHELADKGERVLAGAWIYAPTPAYGPVFETVGDIMYAAGDTGAAVRCAQLSSPSLAPGLSSPLS